MKAPPKTQWKRFADFLSAPEDASALALVRVLCAGTVALHVGRFVGSGAADVALVHQARGGLSLAHGWLEPLGGATVDTARLLCLVCVAAAASATLGLFTRPALIVTWLSLRAIGSLNPTAHGSYDALLVDTLFVLILSGCGRAWSIDARYRGKGGPATRWPRILLVAQIALLYLGSGITKASSSWIPGGDASALWYILQQPTWARLGSLPLWAHPLTQVATTLTWLFEIAGPLLFVAVLLRESAPERRWLRALKGAFSRARFVEVYLLFGLALHLGIEATMEIGPFSFAALALYPAALAPDRVRAWMRAPAAGRQRPSQAS